MGMVSHDRGRSTVELRRRMTEAAAEEFNDSEGSSAHRRGGGGLVVTVGVMGVLVVELWSWGRWSGGGG